MGYDLEIMDNFEDVKNLPDLIMVKRIKDPEEKKKKRSQKRREEAKKKKEEAEI